MAKFLIASGKKSALVLFGLSFLVACGDDGKVQGSATTQASPQNASGGASLPGTSGSSANAAPSITGIPLLAATVGSSYRFKMAATDSDGDSLRFIAYDLPKWLSLDPALGLLSGVPTALDVGTYSGLSIAVTDGKSSTPLGPFSVTVYATGSQSRSVTLSWLPPTENVDGSVLLPLMGHRIIYGRTPDSLNHAIVIDNPSVNRYIVEGLNSGTWYFGLIAKTVGGVESAMSGLVSKTIP